jgi:hypothetical protein
MKPIKMIKDLVQKVTDEHLKLFGVIFTILGLLIFFCAFLCFVTPSIDPFKIGVNKFAEFGDFIGGVVGSLWALVGVILLYLTLKSQQDSVKKQEASLKKQQKSIDKNQFENTFFSLLSNYNEIVKAMDLHGEKEEKEIANGRDCFSKILKEPKILELQLKDKDITVKKELYKVVYKDYKSELSHYYGVLYNLFNYVQENEVFDDVKSKEKYIDIARAQMSSDETKLLAYHGLYNQADDVKADDERNFKDLIERCDLLKYMDKDVKESWKERYD